MSARISVVFGDATETVTMNVSRVPMQGERIYYDGAIHEIKTVTWAPGIGGFPLDLDAHIHTGAPDLARASQ